MYFDFSEKENVSICILSGMMLLRRRRRLMLRPTRQKRLQWHPTMPYHPLEPSQKGQHGEIANSNGCRTRKQYVFLDDINYLPLEIHSNLMFICVAFSAMVNEEASMRRRLVCYRLILIFTEILKIYFYRHSMRLGQRAVTTADEARLILKPNFCCQPKSILKDNVKIFHSENPY